MFPDSPCLRVPISRRARYVSLMPPSVSLMPVSVCVLVHGVFPFPARSRRDADATAVLRVVSPGELPVPVVKPTRRQVLRFPLPVHAEFSVP